MVKRQAAATGVPTGAPTGQIPQSGHRRPVATLRRRPHSRRASAFFWHFDEVFEHLLAKLKSATLTLQAQALPFESLEPFQIGHRHASVL